MSKESTDNQQRRKKTGERLQWARTNWKDGTKQTREEFAAKFGVSSDDIESAERGTLKQQRILVPKVAAAVGISEERFWDPRGPIQLFGETEDNEPEEYVDVPLHEPSISGKVFLSMQTTSKSKMPSGLASPGSFSVLIPDDSNELKSQSHTRYSAGQILFFRVKREPYKPGDLVIAEHLTETTVDAKGETVKVSYIGRYGFRDGSPWITPINPAYPPLMAQGMPIRGIAIILRTVLADDWWIDETKASGLPTNPT